LQEIVDSEVGSAIGGQAPQPRLVGSFQHKSAAIFADWFPDIKKHGVSHQETSVSPTV
jgi:hypothetical protein